ncbi:MAG TPA: hypothetical protein VKB80_18090 [Kofleriaceae bacterium]|nr:hypothetical protein [Kofleriaceae bacterium]
MIGWRQQPDSVPGRALLTVIGATLVAIALGTAIAWGLVDCGGGRPLAVHPVNRVPPEVSAMETTQFGVRAQGLEDRRAASAWLSSYGWVDREHGVVHIPIEAAIDLYLRRRGGARP